MFGDGGAMAPSSHDAGDDDATQPVVLGTIGGRYVLQQELGSGGMGTVYSALDLQTQSMVALKLLMRRQSPMQQERFVREARATLMLEHPNIVRLLDFGVGPSSSFFQVLELLVGDTLAVRMARQEPFGSAEIFAIVTPLLSALGEAHRRGLVHRDLKPDNIFLAREGRQGDVIVPKVIDFGMVLDVDANEPITRAGALVGTPLYMPPEQIQGKRVGPAADIWSLGVIVYQMVCGRLPFRARKLMPLYAEQCKGVFGFPDDHPLRNFVLTCLSFDPEPRLRAPQLFPRA